jgi:hypothetical protein
MLESAAAPLLLAPSGGQIDKICMSQNIAPSDDLLTQEHVTEVCD